MQFIAYSILFWEGVMGLFDSDGFGNSKSVKNKNTFTMSGVDLKSNNINQNVKSNSDFDKTLVGKINPLVKLDVINDNYSLEKMLRNYGCYRDGSTMYCPFHDDDVTGKPSAKFHHDTDTLYCFSENKVYTAYHALKILYGQNVNTIFNRIWKTLTKEERLYYIGKYDEGNSAVVVSDSDWEYYDKNILSRFKNGSVSFIQYKNALYHVLEKIQE